MKAVQVVEDELLLLSTLAVVLDGLAGDASDGATVERRVFDSAAWLVARQVRAVSGAFERLQDELRAGTGAVAPSEQSDRLS